jgi:hypothetical protein
MESLRMMTLLSLGGPISPRLRSLKSFQVISSSREVSRKASFSLEDRSTTEIPLEGLPCSYIGDSSPQEETSSEEVGGGEHPVREGGGAEESLDEDEDPLT